MFAPYCTAHRSRVLLPMASITRLDSTENGIVANFTCICGEEGIWIGRR